MNQGSGVSHGGLHARVLESLLADGIGHDDRGLDERERVRVQQPVLSERPANLPEFQLDTGNARRSRPDFLGVDLTGAGETDVGHERPVRVDDGDQADLRRVECEAVGLVRGRERPVPRNSALARSTGWPDSNRSSESVRATVSARRRAPRKRAQMCGVSWAMDLQKAACEQRGGRDPTATSHGSFRLLEARVRCGCAFADPTSVFRRGSARDGSR